MTDRRNTIRIAVREFGPFETALQKIGDSWCRENNHDIKLEAVPMDLHRLHSAILEKGGLKKGDWDIAHICTDWMAEAELSGAVEDLSPYLQREPPADYPHGWSSSLLDLQQSGGRTLGLPFHDGPECLIYRKDLFEDPAEREGYRQRFGIELEPPETWDDFLRTARYFHRPEKGLYGAALAAYPDGHNAVFDFCLHVWTRGGTIISREGAICIDTPAACEGLRFYKEILNDPAAVHPGSRGFESVKCGAAFARGEAAMMINWFGFAAVCELDAGSEVTGRVKVAPVPHGPSGEGVSLNVYWLYAIGSGSRHKAIAYDFIRFAVSRENDKLLTREGGIGCRISTWKDEEINKQVPYYHQLEKLHQNARTLPKLRNWAEIAGIIDEAVQEALNGNASVEEILKKGQLKINQLN